MKRVAWYTIIVLITVTVLVLLWQFRQAVTWFLISLAISFVFHPMIDRLAKGILPRYAALIAAYFAVLALVVGLLLIMSGPLVRELEQVSNKIAIRYDQIHSSWLENGNQTQRTLAEQIPAPDELFVRIGGEEGVQLFQGLVDITTNLTSFFGRVGLILILSLYWSADQQHFERLLLSLIPLDRRAQARRIWLGIEKGVGAYIRSEFIQSLLAGILLWIGYRVMGLEYPVLLAVLGALAWLIPWFGALLAMIPALLAGLAISIPLSITAALFTLIVMAVQEYVIEPKIFKRERYNLMILVIIILILTEAFGLIGLILAPLLSAVIQNILKYLAAPPDSSLSSDAAAAPGAIAVSLRARLEETKAAISNDDQAPSPIMMSLVGRLDHLIGETEQFFIETARPPGN